MSPLRRGMSLVEVMIAATIFTFMATALVSAFIQNARFARSITLRTVATTSAIGVAEQIRAVVYADFALIHDDPANKNLLIEVFDPNVTDNSAAIDVSDPDAVTMAAHSKDSGMRLVKMPINVVDGAPFHGAWTSVTIPMVLSDDGTANRVPVQMRFWLTSQRRQPTTTVDQNGVRTIVTRCQLFEIALIYQWMNPNFSDTKWHSGVIRLITPNLDMNTPDTPAAAS